MRKDSRHLADSFVDDDDDHGGWLKRFIARDETIDRRALWRMAFWGVGAVAMVTFAVAIHQVPQSVERMRLSTADLAARAQRAEAASEENRLAARRFAAAIDTLNGDRDRLFGRISTIEQNLDSVTGSIAQQNVSMPKPSPALVQAEAPHLDAKPEATPPATEKPALAGAGKSAPPAGLAPSPPKPFVPIEAQPASAAAVATEMTRAAGPASDAADDALPSIPVRQTQFGIDIGGAASLPALRTLWKTAREAHGTEFASLYPVVAIRERGRGGMQLRLVAGPIRDAAAAQRICARVSGRIAGCEATLFEGQRLDFPAEAPRPKIIRARPKPPVNG